MWKNRRTILALVLVAGFWPSSQASLGIYADVVNEKERLHAFILEADTYGETFWNGDLPAGWRVERIGIDGVCFRDHPGFVDLGQLFAHGDGANVRLTISRNRLESALRESARGATNSITNILARLEVLPELDIMDPPNRNPNLPTRIYFWCLDAPEKAGLYLAILRYRLRQWVPMSERVSMAKWALAVGAGVMVVMVLMGSLAYAAKLRRRRRKSP